MYKFKHIKSEDKFGLNDLQAVMYDIALDNIKDMLINEAENYLKNDAIPISGSVSGLIYHSETEPIAKEYHDEIIELYKEIYGENIPSDKLDLNNMTWFAFEYYVLNDDSNIDEILELAKKYNLLKHCCSKYYIKLDPDVNEIEIGEVKVYDIDDDIEEYIDINECWMEIDSNTDIDIDKLNEIINKVRA